MDIAEKKQITFMGMMPNLEKFKSEEIDFSSAIQDSILLTIASSASKAVSSKQRKFTVAS